MFFTLGDTATRRHPGHSPWVPTFLIVGFLLIAGGITWGVATDWPGTAQSQSVPPVQEVQIEESAPDFSATVESTPTQSEPEAVASATPRAIEVPWVLLGTGKPTTETADRLGIPWRKWAFVPAVEAAERLNPPGQTGGIGDGTAYLFHPQSYFGDGIRQDNPVLYFTPNQGKTWFRVQNPYPGESQTTPDMVGANIEGDNLVLFLGLQPESWVRAWWRAEIPLAELERPAP